MKRSRRQALGQHFLTNRAVLGKIIGVIAPGPGDVIVEIGAGKGALTTLLAEKAGRVIAIEKDAGLIPDLKKVVPANVNIIVADALTFDFRQLLGSLGVSTVRVVGNLPYVISTPLLFRVLDERRLISDAVFLFQKEVAERIIAGPGSKKYAPLGILLQNDFEARIAFTVAPGSFSPPPKVQSALLALRRRLVPHHPGVADEPFRTFLKAAFAERRKMLWKNLARRATPAALDTAYAALGLARNARAEELSPDALFALFRALES